MKPTPTPSIGKRLPCIVEDPWKVLDLEGSSLARKVYDQYQIKVDRIRLVSSSELFTTSEGTADLAAEATASFDPDYEVYLGVTRTGTDHLEFPSERVAGYGTLGTAKEAYK